MLTTSWSLQLTVIFAIAPCTCHIVMHYVYQQQILNASFHQAQIRLLANASQYASRKRVPLVWRFARTQQIDVLCRRTGRKRRRRSWHA